MLLPWKYTHPPPTHTHLLESLSLAMPYVSCHVSAESKKQKPTSTVRVRYYCNTRYYSSQGEIDFTTRVLQYRYLVPINYTGILIAAIAIHVCRYRQCQYANLNFVHYIQWRHYKLYNINYTEILFVSVWPNGQWEMLFAQYKYCISIL